MLVVAHTRGDYSKGKNGATPPGRAIERLLLGKTGKRCYRKARVNANQRIVFQKK